MDAYDGIETGRLLIGDFGLATEDRFAADFGSGTSFYTSPEAAGYFRRIGSNGGAGASAIGGALLSPIHLMTDSKSGLAIPSPAEPGKSFQWENRLSYDTFISDIWSIGIVLINLICERNPWQCALHVDDTFRAYVEDPHNTLIAVLPSLSDESHELLKKVLKVNPRDRITLQEFKEEMLKIKEFVKLGAEQDIIIEDSALRHDSWLDVGPRESTPGSASAASQGPSIGSTSGWLTTDASSTRSHLSKSNTPLSSYDSTSDSKSQLSSAQNVPAEINSGINATKPKRPLPIPLQIDPYRLSAALPGHVSASLASARYAAYARPGSAIPFPIQIPNTAPVIRLTSAQSHVQSTRKEHGGETINNVVKLRMPPSPAVMRERQAQQKEEKQARINSSDFMRVDEEGDMAVNLSFPPLHSPAVDSLAASVPCQLSLSGSTDESSESGVVTPVDQTGPYVALKGEKEDAEREEKAGVYKDREHLREANDRPEMGDDQWLTIKPGQEAMHQRYLSSQLSSDLPPITPTEGQFSLKSLEAPPLTPLLLTPTSGRRYHPYGGNPYSGQAALINSPLRMAQQAFLESHYRQYGGRDGYLGAGNTLAAHHAYAGGPRRGSVPEARTMGANGSRVNGGGGADLMSRFAGREKKK